MKIEKLYDHVYDWIIKYGPGLIVGVLVLLVGLWLINLFVKWSHSGMHRKNVDPSLKPFLLSLIAVALRILLVLGVMQIVGIQMTLFAALIGALGVAVGLALSGTLQNFASGVLILLLKPFVVGDNIIAQGQEGTVISIQIFYTVITTYDNRTVIVPNSKLSNEVIINISREGTRRLDLELKMPNNIDIKEVKSVIDEAINKTESILPKPERRIGVGTIEADGYRINVNLWVNAHGFQDTKLAIQEIILQSIKDAGIKIPGM
ncbi:mechanosensitive ion channel family protein [Mucilaginibacter ginsenosidivorax]|uniref:Mechanosensitive ion channel family protein n=1 Tax=Mucilaginibacter ginsenosidivorax TaxID=862126 RepID=A0A5B8W8T0_9SPHI|nr:mechanosensitive ion channel family protein [Mucilaginibacter ginsenosidivorax]QEC79867.1 mechanosensitive ion channel family protein [Mucilaginibacter ginsenosidivorax]